MGSGDSIILTGFMGVGKSAVGRVVAERLGRPFVDMDERIEADAGKSISRIFEEDGEDAFRAAERRLCEELTKEGNLVIATGGGALVDEGNRRVLAETGTVICLTCGADEILRRLASATDRPLLQGEPRRKAIERLLDERYAAYDALPWHIDTTHRSLDEVADRVIQIGAVRRLHVQRASGGTYDILLGSGLLEHLGDAIRATGVSRGTDAVLISNPVVAPLYADPAAASLVAAGLAPHRVLVPDGESHKTLETVRSIYDRLVEIGVDRSAVVVGLGGGVTGDIAGFAAATYLRGLRFVQVPTTLLAMVDSSVGGKTGVDLPEGKNLVGAFKQPEVVVIDPGVLRTLPEEEMRSGLAEAIKHGVLSDPELFSELSQDPGDIDQWSGSWGGEWIARTVAVKVDVVEGDPLEHGRRMVLNLGHTVGHALEQLSEYELRHGEAVAIGMVAAARLAVRSGEAAASLAETIESALRRAGLPTVCPDYRVSEIAEAMRRDKKRGRGRLRWILPRAIGEVIVTDEVPHDLVHEVLIEMGARSS